MQEFDKLGVYFLKTKLEGIGVFMQIMSVKNGQKIATTTVVVMAIRQLQNVQRSCDYIQDEADNEWRQINVVDGHLVTNRREDWFGDWYKCDIHAFEYGNRAFDCGMHAVGVDFVDPLHDKTNEQHELIYRNDYSDNS